MSFADSFWSQEYDKGFKALFEQLYEGVYEDDDFVSLFTARMELELVYGTQLESIESSRKSATKRQSNDDYVSLIKNSYQKMNENFLKQGELHIQIAASIKQLVLDPFANWCKDHKQRVEYSEDFLLEKHKRFRNAKNQLEKLQKKYFNKCRMLEEFKSHYTEEELEEELVEEAAAAKAAAASAKSVTPEPSTSTDPDTSGKIEVDESDTYAIGHLKFDSTSIKTFLSSLLTTVPISSHKVAILGTYHNVSTGSGITQWLLDNYKSEFNIEKAEDFGQDLINQGFIRLIGSMNKNFINSSQFFYQWKPLAFDLAGVASGQGTADSLKQEGAAGSSDTANGLSNYLEDMKLAIGVNTVDFNDRSQLSKLIKEVNLLDSQYFQSTLDLDQLRCKYEEDIMDHLAFMQKCELDRMKAVKKATFDFLGCFSNKVVSMKLTCDELMIIEETIQPMNDLKFLIENYQTGKFKPQVVLYDNYYNSNIRQTFGVDLATKSRLDRKVVPIILQCLLSYLDKTYPQLSNDEERVNLWTKAVHLNQVHQLRFKLNELTDPQQINSILNGNPEAGTKPVHPLVVTNLFKLYFMELPDSVVPHNVYDLIKSLYLNYPFGSSDNSINDSRINGLQNVLVDLPKCNIATLDAILTHLTRLIQIIGTKNQGLSRDFKDKLSKEFGSLILRPKLNADFLSSDSYIHDKHQVHFMNDLFGNKEAIFKELRRRASSRVSSTSSKNGAASVSAAAAASLSAAASTSSGPAVPPKRAATLSKSRLESRLQNVVHKKLDPKESSESKETKDTESEDKNGDTPSSTSHSNSLKRSTSPRKKKSSTLLLRLGLPSVVSSKPSKKDIVFEQGNNSSSDSLKEFGQPKFTGSLGRKTSVKDLASQFDSDS